MAVVKYCQNGPGCLNPIQALRPTRLKSDDAQFCHFCTATKREAQETKADASSPESFILSPDIVAAEVLPTNTSGVTAPSPIKKQKKNSATINEQETSVQTAILRPNQNKSEPVPRKAEQNLSADTMESIHAGALEIRIPYKKGILTRAHKYLIKSSAGRTAYALFESVALYLGVVGRFWAGAAYGVTAAAAAALRGLLLKRSPMAAVIRGASSLKRGLIWSGLLTGSLERAAFIVSSVLIMGSTLSLERSAVPQGIFLGYAGVALAVGSVLRRVIVYAGKRTVEDHKPHWYIDWTNSSGLSSSDIYEFNNSFEKTITDMFHEMGFTTTHVGVENAKAITGHEGSGDGGVDVIADDSAGKRLIISCKRYSGKVGPDEIKILSDDLSRMHGLPAHKGKVLVGVIVTTVGFTSGAIELAALRGIATISIESLRDQAERHYLA